MIKKEMGFIRLMYWIGVISSGFMIIKLTYLVVNIIAWASVADFCPLYYSYISF